MNQTNTLLLGSAYKTRRPAALSKKDNSNRDFIIKSLIYWAIICTIILIYILFTTNSAGVIKTAWTRPIFSRYPIKTIKYDSTIHNRLIIYFETSSNIDTVKKLLPTFLFSSNFGNITFLPSDYKLNHYKNNIFTSEFIIPINGPWFVKIIISNFIVSQFLYSNNDLSLTSKNYTTMFCYGKDFNDRYCQVNNSCYDNNKFMFFSNLRISLVPQILYPGSRPIPRDYPCCRRVIRFLYQNKSFDSFEYKNKFTERCIITCRWYGMQHIWHSLFDFTLPIWWSKQMFWGHNDEDRVMVIDENKNTEKGYQFIDILTHKNVINIKLDEKYHNKTCFSSIILGVPKTELEVTPSKWPNGYQLPYEFADIAFHQFREHSISTYNVNNSLCGKTTKPRVIFINRDTNKRYIINSQDLINKMKEWAPDVDIDYVVYTNQTIGEQIAQFCNASLIISIHGSALSHMLWMRRNRSAIIEIFPYNYDCRDWYEQVAKGMGIKYFFWINKIPENSFQGRLDMKNYDKCKEEENSCLKDKCHEMLRDQPTIVDFKSFKPVFDNALQYIRRFY
ncbi:hypothetical protein TVAG_527360 [Trichomonas vaginalis G3]|uniref:Glycosyltransferase 61 catalytic domain-containing protein n=1 Tax=Trichomonas vaginalis (strain ATCC PRA-98 / G3) TaxID=412133 RepID=A2GBB7_TRIV3|nr:hypothetical protein TVAG_527360 [Trichomonas vaginalis G3]|eukprot:XP_001298478.1 hypothetical protein [Trichomonas vaginalis G3]